MSGPPFSNGDKVRLRHFPSAYFTVQAVQVEPQERGGHYTGKTGLQQPLGAYGDELELVPEPEPVREVHPKGSVLGFRTGSEECFTVQEYEPLPLSRGGVYSGTSTSGEHLVWCYGDGVVLRTAVPPKPPLTAARIVEAVAKAGQYDGFQIESAEYATGSGRRAIAGKDATGRRFVAYVSVLNLKYLD